MTILEASILGLVQGLTEFLPISSTAHLRIIPALVGWPDPGAAFTAVIQIGTLVAVLMYFSKDIARITAAVVKGVASGRPLEDDDSRLGWMICAGTLPIVILGLTFKHSIETSLRSLYVISASMIILALLLVVAEIVTKRRLERGVTLKGIERLSWSDAILVGFSQAVALIPGSSRSGTTITGGLLVGMNRETAARYSFLLSLPAVFAAAILELMKERNSLLSSNIGAMNLIVATVVAGVVGYASIAFLLGYLKKHTLYLFVVYRLIVGFGLLGLVGYGLLPAN